MKISRRWLSDFVEFEDLSTEDFAELITTRVAEVDEILSHGVGLDSIRVARVLRAEKIPQKDKLQRVRLGLGDSEVDVVCGASNCREGIFVAYAPPGSSFSFQSGSSEPEIIAVEKKAVGGVESNGLLLSEKELGLGSDDVGILEINDKLISERGPQSTKGSIELGSSFADSIFGSDTILEIDNKSLTHRPDLWSHFGFARELSALLGRPLKKKVDEWVNEEKFLADLKDGAAITSVRIEEGSGCRRFLALNFDEVVADASPFWMRSRLHAIGAGVRNVLVDLSNYVMHDIGQPNHAYDSKLLATNSFEIRRAKSGEKLITLDESELELSVEDIVVTDGNKPVALGGVIGGLGSSILDSTTSLVLECANFDPVLVRQSAKRHNIRTDASNRFEKSLSAYSAQIGIFRFAELLQSLQPQSKISGALTDTFIEKPKSVTVPYRCSYIRQRLGAELADDKIEFILSGLGFDLSNPELAQVPYYRATRDISIEDDLVEEVGRIFGYENVGESAPLIASTASSLENTSAFRYSLSDTLRGMGFSEISNYSFVSPEKCKKLGYSLERSIEVQNPVDIDLSHIRGSLVPGMCQAIEKNARQFKELALFEYGSVYQSVEKESSKDSGAEQKQKLCLAYCSGSNEKKAGALFSPPVEQGEAFYSLLSVLKRLCALRAGITFSVQRLEKESLPSWCHPYRSAGVFVAGERIGIISEIKKGILDDVTSRVVLSEIDISVLLSKDAGAPKFSSISKFPDSFFEMSVVMPRRDEYRKLERLILSNVDSKLLRDMEVVSVYEGEPLAAGEKSVSVKLYLGARDRTLSSEELSNIQNNLMQGVEASSYHLRA
jgi:phenylalanyl-tRNA synthetase beta chain